MSFVLQISTSVGREIQELTQSEFFIFALPFLFVFALSYGLLSQAGDKGIPQEKSARAVISLLLGLFVLPIAPTLKGFLSPVATSLLIVVGGLLVFIILVELLRVGKGRVVGVTITREGKEVRKEKEELFTRHSRGFALVLIILAFLVFFNAGGLQLLGIETPQFFFNAPLIFFLVVILLVVWFVVAKEE